MKKILSTALVTLLLISGLFVLVGCNKEEKKEEKKATDLSKFAGTYEGLYTQIVGDDTKVEDEEFSLELKADGTGVHNRDDYSFKVTWSLDGENFKMTETFVGDPIEYTGTLKDGKLDIFNGDPEKVFTFEYVYQKK